MFCFHNEKNITVCTHKKCRSNIPGVKTTQRIMNDRRQPIYQNTRDIFRLNSLTQTNDLLVLRPKKKKRINVIIPKLQIIES